MRSALLCVFGIGALLASAANPTVHRRQDGIVSNDKFVQTQGSQFTLNGSRFRFVGTNAYWLQALNTDQDVVTTLTSIRKSGITVVRTWAFNDVDVIPSDNSTWFQLIANGTTTVNNGTNGLQKLDSIIRHAENLGIHLMLTLTNNWNPRPALDNLTASLQNLSATVDSSGLPRRDVTIGTNNSLPRNTLSNDYGGMDVYVRQFGLKNHDDFYTNETIISAFMNYTTSVVSRYRDSPAVLAWEIANDPRCNSSLAATATCNTTTVTSWIAKLANHIKNVDPNHLVTSGTQGFLCEGCTKSFPRAQTPRPSPAPGQVVAPPLTKRKLEQEWAERRKKRRAAARKASQAKSGMSIRGKWRAPETKRQENAGVTALNDGSQGVDSEDIINIPQIGFGTFQLFPDQNTYGPGDPTLSPFNNTVEIGIDWIKRQAAVSALFGKPISLSAFGLVTQENAPQFVPFNSTVAPFSNATGSGQNIQPYGVTDQQRDDAYAQWIQAGIEAGLQGIIQYQWGQVNLTGIPGTAIVPALNETGQSPVVNQTGVSPNDGYSIQGVGEVAVQGVLQQGQQAISSG